MAAECRLLRFAIITLIISYGIHISGASGIFPEGMAVRTCAVKHYKNDAF